jgi:hypothetical protein
MSFHDFVDGFATKSFVDFASKNCKVNVGREVLDEIKIKLSLQKMCGFRDVTTGKLLV